VSEGQFFFDSASHHQKKIGGGLQGFALHPENTNTPERFKNFSYVQIIVNLLNIL
jgi:hypothetical protein